jgi:hypothetical protein
MNWLKEVGVSAVRKTGSLLMLEMLAYWLRNNTFSLVEGGSDFRQNFIRWWHLQKWHDHVDFIVASVPPLYFHKLLDYIVGKASSNEFCWVSANNCVWLYILDYD